MGHSKASKREHHEAIVGVAASRFREDGIERVGVADLMHDAGLTHGGFYRHFESRDQLVAEAVERALHDGGQAMAAVAESPHDPLAAVIDAYLSVSHRDNLGTSCAVTTLAGDVARSHPRARAAYTDQVRIYIDMLMRIAPAADVRPESGDGHHGLVDPGRRGVDGTGGQRRGPLTGDPRLGRVGAQGAARLNVHGPALAGAMVHRRIAVSARRPGDGI